MEEDKIPLPAWLPWAAVACLAAMLACVGELWLVEKARGRLTRDQVLMAEAALKGAENQLEAERIVGRREFGAARAEGATLSGLRVELLSPQDGPTAQGRAAGVIVWESGGSRALLRTYGLPGTPPGRDYQLWLDGPGQDYPADCGVLGTRPPGGSGEYTASLPSPFEEGCRFLLVECRKGGCRTLEEARSGGSIVLASLPHTGSIPRR